jgi:RNA-directed DNA polymerase
MPPPQAETNEPSLWWVLSIQRKLHHWATEDWSRKSDDLLNLVADPAYLRGAWERVQSNKGACTAGIDKALRGPSRPGRTSNFPCHPRVALKSGKFPVPVPGADDPKANGMKSRLADTDPGPTGW